MEEAIKFINGSEVISLNDEKENILINHHTYKAEDFLKELERHIGYNKVEKWLTEGVDCEILEPQKHWQKGKIKICLQFIPEKPKSVLDDIRQDIDTE